MRGNENSILIGYKDVEHDIIMLSEYIAAKAGEYERMRAITYDADLLRTWFRSAIQQIAFILDRVLSRDIETTPDAIRIELKHSNRHSRLLPETIKGVITYYVVCQWLKLVQPSLLSIYDNEYNERKMLLAENATYREMPK